MTYLNREQRIESIQQAARRAAERVPSIRRVILFGSLVEGIPTPRSDADLLVEVASSPHPAPRDRIPDMLRALAPLPCPIDLVVLTTDEIERGRQQGSALLGLALTRGRDLLST